MIYPTQIQTRKAKVAYWIFYQLYTFDQGKNKVLGKPTTFLPEIGGLYVILKFTGTYDPPLWVIVTAISLGILLSWILGRVYMFYHLDEIESMVGTLRNPISKEIHDNVAKKRNNF